MSNGPVTFAAFLYADTDTIIHRAIGFDAGDGVKSATILSVGSEFNSSILSEANIFRIDGMLNLVLYKVAVTVKYDPYI